MPPVDYLAEAICRQKQKQKQQSAPTDSAAVVDAVLRETREAAIPDAAPAMDPHRAAARQRLARAPHALQGKGGRAHRTAIAGTPPRAAASEGEGQHVGGGGGGGGLTQEEGVEGEGWGGKGKEDKEEKLC